MGECEEDCERDGAGEGEGLCTVGKKKSPQNAS